MSAFSAFGRPKSRSRDDHSTRSVSLDTDAAEPGREGRAASSHDYGTNLEPERSRWGRAQSKSGFLGFFRGKSKEPNVKQSTLPEGERVARTSLAPPMAASRLSSMPAIRTSTQYEETQQRNHSSSGIEAPPLDANSLSPFAQAPNTRRVSRIPLDPPPLSSVYSQATKHGFVTTPAGSTEALLRAHMAKHSSHYDETELSPPGAGADHPAIPLPAFTTKVYVLTTAGCLLQYADDGNSDRKPEKVMQLTSESAAMACDAIPGKHWVLHVCESFVGNEPVLNPRVSRFGFTKLGIGAKKGTENYLMIMESPEELDSWLMAIRHEIQFSGRQDFKLDRPATSSTAAGLDDDENISPRSSYAHEVTASEAPLVRVERTTSKVQRKPVGSRPSVSSLPKATDPSQKANTRPSTSDSNTAHQMNPNILTERDHVGGKDFVARVSTESNGPEHGRGNETLQDEGQPSRTLGPVCPQGSAPSHRSQHSIDSLSSQPSNSQRNRLATTGRRRSSSVQSSGTTRGVLKEGIPAADHVPPRHQSPTGLPAARSPSDSRSSHHQASVTGLRKRTTVIKIGSSDTSAPQEPALAQESQTQADRRDRPEQDVRRSSIEKLDGLATSTKASSIDQNLGSVAAAQQQHLRNSFRRLTPDPEHGPIVLTPPESPHVIEHRTNGNQTTTSSVIDPNSSASTLRSKAPRDDAFDDGLGASPTIQDIQSPSLSAQPLDDHLNSPLSTTTDLMPGDSPTKAVAIVIPLATARPIQVDVPRSPTFSPSRSHSFASLKRRSTDQKQMSTEAPTGVSVPSAEAPSASGDEPVGPVDVICTQHEAEDLEIGQRTHSSSMSSVNSSVKSSTSRIPPRQSSLLYGHGIIPHSVPTSMAGSAPNSGRSTPSSAHRKESVASTKTSQLRQKLAAIDTARLSHANSAHLFTPSPHPAPTGALPALPPGASKGRSPVASRPSSRADRSRAPSATSLRTESVAGSVSCRKPSESDEQSLTPDRGHSRSASQELTGGEIVESTRSRRPKVERVTLAPMSDVTGVAERRRNRSPSPGNYNEQEHLPKAVPRPSSPSLPLLSAAPDSRIKKSTGWRSGKALSLIRESSVRSTSTLIARSERNNRTEIEQIEEDLDSHDDTLPLSEKISPDALNSELFLDLDTTSPTAREIQEAHTESQARLHSLYGELGKESVETDDAFDEIPIALAVSPRAVSTQPTAPLDGTRNESVGLATGAGHDEGNTATSFMQYPKRTSSMSQSGASQGYKAERPMLLRLATTGSLQKVDTIETPSTTELTSASSVGSSSDTPTGALASHTRVGGHSPPMPPPSRPPPPPPISASASSSSVASPSDSSVASPASRTTSPSVPMSKFSPQAAQWSNAGSTAFYTRKSSETDESERSETDTFAGSLASVATRRSKQTTPPPPPPPPPPPKSSLAALARAAAPERTPPLQMQASVTDFSQDDFFGWSMPVYSGYSSEKSARDRDELEGHENMDTPRASTYGNGDKTMPEISNTHRRQEPEPLYQPLELSGLQLSLGDGLRVEPVRSSEAETQTDGTSDARDPRWSLFGAIEGINYK